MAVLKFLLQNDEKTSMMKTSMSQKSGLVSTSASGSSPFIRNSFSKPSLKAKDCQDDFNPSEGLMKDHNDADTFCFWSEEIKLQAVTSPPTSATEMSQQMTDEKFIRDQVWRSLRTTCAFVQSYP